MTTDDFGRYASGIILALLVFGMFILAAILRIRERKRRILEEPSSSNLSRIGIFFDWIILIGTLFILCIGLTMMLGRLR